jgi:HK97 family phage portal protein
MELKFLPGLIGRVRNSLTGSQGSPVSHAISGSTAATSGPYGGAFTVFGGGWDVEQSVTQGLERVIWVQRCIDAIASNQSKLKFIVRKGDPRTGKIVPDDDLNYTLNRKPNGYETAKQFRYRLSAQSLISKRGVFIEKQRAESGRWRLHLLPPHLVEPIPDPEKFVSGYRLMTANNGEVHLDADKVIWIRTKPHPIDPYLQLTPLTSAGLAIETDFLARLFNRNFLMNDGRPGLLINIAGEINPRDAEEIKRRFTGSPHQAGRTTVIESEGVTINDLSASPRDLQWLEAITGTKSDILLAFGTPESVLGNASGRTYDNADAESEVWWEETMVPHCDGIASPLDILTGSTDDENFLTFDYDEVDVLQRRKRARQQTIIDGFGKGVNTLDEVMEVTGREKWDVPGTRVLILPNGVVVGKNDADVEAVAQLPAVGVEQQADVAKEAQRGAEMGAALGQRNFGNMISARATRIANGEDQYGGPRQSDYALAKSGPRVLETKEYVESSVEDYWDEPEEKEHPYAALWAEVDSNFGLLLNEWSDFQEETILGRLDHRKARQYTRHWEGEVKAIKPLNSRYVVDTGRWANGLQSDMERLLRKATHAALKEASEEMAASGITEAMRAMGLGGAAGRSPLMKVFGTRQDVDSAVSGLLTPFNDVVTTAAANQSDRIAKVISDLDAQGASMTDIKTRVRDMMGTRGSWRQSLSSALTTSVIEAARHEAFSKAGPIVNKIWNTVADEAVRRTHEAADGSEVPIGTTFKIGKWHMDYPGDPKGGIEERINCRCYTDYVISPDAEELYDLTAGED